MSKFFQSILCAIILTTYTSGLVAQQRSPLVYYDFSEAKGQVIRDRSGVGAPLDLEIDNPKAVQWHSGSLSIKRSTIIRSKSQPKKLMGAIRRSDAITIEAWVRPANIQQKGPARIVSFSKDSVRRNFTLGQDGNRFDVRFRTTSSSENGLPSLATRPGVVTPQVTHVVYTRGRSGSAKCYVNGRQVSNSVIRGNTSNWNDGFSFVLGNELTKDRPWLGTFYLLAVYAHELTAAEIVANFKAGASRKVTGITPEDTGNALFESKVAALLADRCLECHDAANRKGGLDLSRRSLALRGGETGKAIVPQDLQSSLLWQLVDADEMPHDREPLSETEKDLLRTWILSGARWTLATIDPVIYSFGFDRDTAFVQRLTVPEFVATVNATFGVDVRAEARQMLPRDFRADGFSNTSYNLNVDLGHVNAYAKLADVVVDKMDLLAFAKRFSKSRRLTDDDARNLIRKMGRWVLRGPIEDHELAVLRGVTTSVMAAGGSFEDAVGYLVRAMIQSPRFIYRMESQIGDGSMWPISEHELASRFSYIMWGSSPDEQLSDAADKGQLAEQSDYHIDRMFKDPRAVERSEQFVIDWLDLDRLNNLRPDKKHFPNWDSALAKDMRRETVAFFRHLVWTKDQSLSSLMNAQVSFMSPKLAKHYGISAQASGFGQYDMSDESSRGGLLTQGSILTVGGDEASMVSRGLFVMQNLLRGVVKDPPPCVDTTPVPTRTGLTQRGIAEGRIADFNCGGCHSKFEPLAFGLEPFDGLGSFRLMDEHGNRMRADGEILFPGDEEPTEYRNSAELMDLLAASDRVRESITWKLTQFSLGRPLTALDAREVAKIHRKAMDEGGTYRSTLKAILNSELVRSTRTVVVEPQ